MLYHGSISGYVASPAVSVELDSDSAGSDSNEADIVIDISAGSC